MANKGLKPVKGFHPSPTKRIKFADGEVMELNRKERRRMKIYNRDLKPSPKEGLNG